MQSLPCESSVRGGYPSFRRAKIGRRGFCGQSFQSPTLRFWAHVSQTLWEYRLCKARKSWDNMHWAGRVLH
eukprot:8107022-Pyramimonas_sp.AAC.1